MEGLQVAALKWGVKANAVTRHNTSSSISGVISKVGVELLLYIKTEAVLHKNPPETHSLQLKLKAKLKKYTYSKNEYLFHKRY